MRVQRGGGIVVVASSGSAYGRVERGGRRGTVETCLLWGPRGLQAQGFESYPRSECRLGFLTRGNRVGFEIGGTPKNIPFSQQIPVESLHGIKKKGAYLPGLTAD
ncbi:hypothetical protein E2C01_059507 [Portunus trituberculatus]|uniref:Uncharacterized protein n=1 Tax=Portunus trituberculatus TaxID=210409 RepID=A0A5B7H5J0_PORTR|nr:hypothetical protein [Portunus trituberculatus]